MLYFITDGASNFIYNKLLHFLSAAIITFALFFMLILFLTLKNSDNLIIHLESEIPSYIYISETADSTEKQKLKVFINSSHFLKKINFITKNEALNEFKNEAANFPELLEGINENPLPDYYEILFKTGQIKERVALKNELAAFTAVESLEFGEENLIKLINIRYWLNRIFISVMIFSGTIIIFIIYCFINLLAYSQKNELEIKKLIGVSKIGLCLPFIFSSFLLFTISTGLALALSRSLLLFCNNNAADLIMKGFKFQFLSNNELTFFISFIIAVSVITAFFSINKFLKYTNEES